MDQLDGSSLVRRAASKATDVGLLTAMQSESYAINFPKQAFREHLFRPWLESGIGRGEVWVYTLNGKVVGWLWLDLSRPRRRAHIVHVQVATEFWGRGIGHRIVEDGMAQAKAAGRRALTLTVTKSNARAMALYEHLGFSILDDRGERQTMIREL